MLQNHRAWIYRSAYSSLIKYATRCIPPNAVAHHEIPVFLVWGAYSCGHIARYNRHGIRHVRQATTPSRWPFHAADRFVERYFLVTAAHVASARREWICLKKHCKIAQNGRRDEGDEKLITTGRGNYYYYYCLLISRSELVSSSSGLNTGLYFCAGDDFNG